MVQKKDAPSKKNQKVSFWFFLKKYGHLELPNRW